MARRTRYRFNCTRGSETREQHILSYSRASAEAWLLRRYDSVEYIGSGTGRAAARSVNPAAGALWRLDPAALREAIAFLGLTLPVKIKQTGHKGGRRGAYSLRDKAGLYHHITVKNWLDPEQACRTLWHELAHAMQAERIVVDHPDAPPYALRLGWAASLDRGTYRTRPNEVEARSYEDYGRAVQIARAV